MGCTVKGQSAHHKGVSFICPILCDILVCVDWAYSSSNLC